MYQKHKKLTFLSLLMVSIFFTSCKKDEPQPPAQIPQSGQYLHLSHPKAIDNPRMDSLVEIVDYKKFDMLWLGGDLAENTTKDNESMTHVDTIFDLGNTNTLWALGNHDYTYPYRIPDFTYRPYYYAYHKNGISFIVLDTQDSLSNIIHAQKDLVESVTDTISESSHLILLHHKLIWIYGNADLEPQADSVSNAPIGDCFYCINPNNFYDDIYPMLLQVKQRGVEVICIAGDIGKKTTEFEFKTSEGIHFLASGMRANSGESKAMLFEHDITNKQLVWEYVLLEDLIGND